MRTKTLIDALCHRFTGLGAARCYGIAMDGTRLHIRQDINSRLLDEFRCRHIRIAQTEIIDILLPVPAVRLRPNSKMVRIVDFFRSKLIHLLIDHSLFPFIINKLLFQ